MRPIELLSKPHVWVTKALGGGKLMRCCANCGVIRRADGKNKPCRAPVSVGPR